MGSGGGILILFGFGSLILEQFGMQFKLLAWAQNFQPWLGIVLGVVGIVLVALSFMRGKSEGQVQPADVQQPPYPQQGQPPQP